MGVDEKLSSPGPLFFAEPPHLRSPDGSMAIWYTEPLGMVDELLTDNMTSATVKFLVETASARLEQAYARAPQPMVFVHVWKRARTYDMAARARLVQWGLTMGAEKIQRIWVLLEPQCPTFVKMACHAGAVPFAVRRIPMLITEDRAEILRQDALRVASGVPSP
ncbi:MAG: hypothetical protein AB2A00_23440 [Myxococcota bacterium]